MFRSAEECFIKELRVGRFILYWFALAAGVGGSLEAQHSLVSILSMSQHSVQSGNHEMPFRLVWLLRHLAPPLCSVPAAGF